jgi:hypothetical protein
MASESPWAIPEVKTHYDLLDLDFIPVNQASQ